MFLSVASNNNIECSCGKGMAWNGICRGQIKGLYPAIGVKGLKNTAINVGYVADYST